MRDMTEEERNTRSRLNHLEERIEELEIERVTGVATALRMLDYLKGRDGGWATNTELRDLCGNGYRNARAALFSIGLVETRKDRPDGGHGSLRILTRYTEGGVHGRVSRRRILEALVVRKDSDFT